MSRLSGEIGVETVSYTHLFLAASDGDGKQVHMRHYLQSIRYEFVKTGKVFTRSDFEPYADELL